MTHRIPGSLSEGSQTWLQGLRDDREFSSTEWRLALLAAEAYDRAQTARRLLAREGLTFEVTRWQGSAEKGALVTTVTAHPACNIARDNVATFSKLVAQLGLDVPAVAEASPEEEGQPEKAPGILTILADRRAG